MKVLYGWDDPLRYFFLVVTEIDEHGKEIRNVFSNLDLQNPAMTINQIKMKLLDLNIEVPNDLESNLKDDQLKNEMFYSDSKITKIMKGILGYEK